MGTLLYPSNRNYYRVEKNHAVDAITEIKSIAKKCSLSFDETLRIYELLEKRRELDVKVSKGDFVDEQFAGFGEILANLQQSIHLIAETYFRNKE